MRERPQCNESVTNLEDGDIEHGELRRMRYYDGCSAVTYGIPQIIVTVEALPL
jgi:hypothetical protein